MEKSTGVVRALFLLGNLKDRTLIDDLGEQELAVLRDMFCSGVSPKDALEAIKLAKGGKDPLAQLSYDEKSSIARGAEKIVFLVSYLTSETVRDAYPISIEEAKSIKQLFDTGNHDQAVSSLQRAINAGLEGSGKTRRVLVKLGTLKGKDVANELVETLMSDLPQGFKALNITPHEVGVDNFTVEVRGYDLTGKNKKLVGKVARLLTYRVETKGELKPLFEIPGVKVEKISSSK